MFAFLGIGNVAKNWTAAKDLWKSGETGKALLSGAKAVGTGGAVYGGGALLGAGAVGAYNAGGGDLLSGGEKSAKKMEFS